MIFLREVIGYCKGQGGVEIPVRTPEERHYYSTNMAGSYFLERLDLEAQLSEASSLFSEPFFAAPGQSVWPPRYNELKFATRKPRFTNSEF
ncbi:hypothetical protein GCM10010918_13870 [Paenibacillus radicis (ex Gao et al. 2016)]|uniref:Uncharacterized protein n=1 Tax=Paenibacillus radicis (ex Gao et al. 2016) TaxID=1737354 RepID=A0A917GZD5_9BACL|nr:hypothetical protein GCM10010918_13870 [Paenibacillus radicis (ex Gao et al. 2016)]